MPLRHGKPNEEIILNCLKKLVRRNKCTLCPDKLTKTIQKKIQPSTLKYKAGIEEILKSIPPKRNHHHHQVHPV